MGADELLRRWARQQREFGDTELVLASLPAREAAALLSSGGRAPAPRPRLTAALDRAALEAPAPEPREAVRDVPAPRPPRPERPVAPTGSEGDWRAALEAAGAAPASEVRRAKAGRRPDPEPAPLAAEAGNADGFVERIAGAQGIAEVAALVAECRRCPLYKTARNPVPGEGNPHADFVIVGEAPGANEDETGRPFIGQAGQLLTKILAAVNLSREDVFIMNVLKHRPPGNRNPSPAEVAACRPFLLRQLELLQPKVILALGTFAAQTLLETKESIGRLRAQEHRYHGIPLVVTYHPAALLRNPNWKRPTWEDVQLARRILDRAPGA